MSKINFDANKVKPQVALDPVPSGWYNAAVVASEIKPTQAKAGKAAGKRLALEWSILDGEFKGRKVFDGFNIENANPVAAEIGQQQLSALCHATGTYKLTDTAQLHDKPHRLKVGLKGARKNEETGEEYDAQNEYKGCEPLEGAAAGGAAAGNPPAWATGKAAPGKATPPPANVPANEPAGVLAPKDVNFLTALFWIVLEGETVEKNGEEILEMLNQGMPADTACMLQDESDWSTADNYFAAEEAAPATPTPPAKKAPPAKKEAPAAAPTGKNTPPWLKGKK